MSVQTNKKVRILKTVERKPHLTYRQIAAAVGCDLSYVSLILKNCGAPSSVFALGRECRRLGLGMNDLRRAVRR